jgi:transcriptional regulator NrdR family protein
VLDDESIKMVIKKIIGILEEIEHREISAQDIQDILLKKYGLQPSPPQENM